MSRNAPLILTLFVMAVLCQRVSYAQNSTLQLRPGEQILVLENGSFVFGLIDRASSGYTVRTRQGSRVVIDREQALFVCDSLEEVYWGRLANLEANDIDGQQALFRWLLQHKLWRLAGNQLEVMKTLRIPIEEFEFLTRQLKIAMDVEIRRFAATRQSPLQNSPNSAAPETVATAEPHSTSKAEENIANLDSRSGYFGSVAPVFSPLPMLGGSTTGVSEQAIAESDFNPGTHQIRQVGYEEPAADSNSHTSSVRPRTIRSPDRVVLSGIEATNSPAQTPTLVEPDRVGNAELTDVKRLPSTPADNEFESSMLTPMESTIGEIPSLDARPVRFVPRDEFDPDIFNRQSPAIDATKEGIPSE